MTLKRRAAGAWVNVATTFTRRLSGAWIDIDIVRRRAAGAWVVAWRRVSISSQSVSHIPPTGAAIAGYRLNASGIAETREGASYTTVGSWIALGTPSDYECMATLLSGTSPSGSSVGSWLPLSASREWSLTQSSSGIKSCSLQVEIRRASTLVVLASEQINLEADHP